MASKCFKNYPTSPVSKQQPNPFHEQVSLISQPYKEQILLATNKLKNQLTRSPTNKDDQHKRLQSYMLTPPV